MAKEFKGYKPDSRNKKTVEDVVKSYENKSENELMGEIMQRYTEGVKNGTMSRDELDNFVKNAEKFLTPEQKQKLRMIINKLKN